MSAPAAERTFAGVDLHRGALVPVKLRDTTLLSETVVFELSQNCVSQIVRHTQEFGTSILQIRYPV